MTGQPRCSPEQTQLTHRDTYHTGQTTRYGSTSARYPAHSAASRRSGSARRAPPSPPPPRGPVHRAPRSRARTRAPRAGPVRDYGPAVSPPSNTQSCIPREQTHFRSNDRQIHLTQLVPITRPVLVPHAHRLALRHLRRVFHTAAHAPVERLARTRHVQVRQTPLPHHTAWNNIAGTVAGYPDLSSASGIVE